MFQVDNYAPTKVVFGAGRLKELATVKLPGKMALICMSGGGSLKRLGILDNVLSLLKQNGTSAVIFDKVMQNPTKKSVEEATKIAKENRCDFVLGLGGGSSIDTAKAIAILMENNGDLWDYAYTGTGKKRAVESAAPVVAISTTSGTGSETDQYSVITKTETKEKLDFAVDAIFPVLSIIDPQLMLTLPRTLTIYQGFDALFHCVECYITNQNKNKIVDMYASEGIRIITKWLPIVIKNGNDLEARTQMAFAANICAGYSMSMIGTTSHHIIAQTMGGLFPEFIHGASLIVIAEEYYKRIIQYFPLIFDKLGMIMGEKLTDGRPGIAFINGLCKLLDVAGMRNLPMSQFGISRSDIPNIADITVNVTGIEDVDLYTLTTHDIENILEKSYC